MADEADKPRREGTKPVTATYLERAAVFYLERYASSSENLRRVLLRKATRRAGEPPGPEVSAMIAEAVEKTIRSGLVDDRSFAGSKLHSLLRRGSSVRNAKGVLAAKGVGADIIAGALAEAEPDDFAQARRYAERKRLGPWRNPPDPARRERDLAALCRAGFSYRAAAAALGSPKNGDMTRSDEA